MKVSKFKVVYIFSPTKNENIKQIWVKMDNGACHSLFWKEYFDNIEEAIGNLKMQKDLYKKPIVIDKSRYGTFARFDRNRIIFLKMEEDDED